MNLTLENGFINQSLGQGKYWYATWLLDVSKSNRYRIEHYGPDGYLTLCQPWLLHHPTVKGNFLICLNHTADYHLLNRHDIAWWYSTKRPAVDIMIAVSALLTITGLIGKYKNVVNIITVQWYKNNGLQEVVTPSINKKY